MEYISTKKEKLTLKEIMFKTLSKILELSTNEFRGGYVEKKVRGDFVEEIYIPDSRKQIIQSIEFFSLLLQPFYDDEMKTKADEIKNAIEENLQEFNDKKINRDIFIINKLRIMKELFSELNYLLSRKKYLQGETYSEEDKTDDEEGDEEDD